MKYPLEDHVAENKEEEARCLDQVRSIIHQRREEGRPVAGMIIEPVQAEGTLLPFSRNPPGIVSLCFEFEHKHHLKLSSPLIFLANLL